MRTEEILRSSYTQEGERFFLVYDPSKAVFRIGTRWQWLVGF